MSIETTPKSTIAAGWYTDPANSAGLRWWDGVAWTNSVRDVAVASARPAPAAEPFPVRGGGFAGASVPGSFAPGRFEARAPIVRSLTHTRSSAWISGQPLWSIVPQLIVVAIIGLGNTPALLAGLAVANSVCLGVLLALAFADRGTLLAGGNGSAASPWWILLSPLAYLIARTLQVRRWSEGGWALVVWWIIAIVLVPPVAVVGVFAFYGLMPI